MHPNSNRLERILSYGRSDSGKSSMWVSIASWLADTETGNRVWLGDTDNAWDAMGYDEIESVVKPSRVTDYISALRWAKSLRVDRNDWVCLDLADKAWPWAQEHYFSQYMPDDDLSLGDIYLRNQLAMERKEGGEGMAGAHGGNWGVIYKYYHGLVNILLNQPCHVLFIAAARELRADTKAAIVAQYKNVGFYPAGPPNENELAHSFHTVLYCAETPINWLYTTIKERGPINKPSRRMLKAEPVSDFVATYLFKVAEWQL